MLPNKINYAFFCSHEKFENFPVFLKPNQSNRRTPTKTFIYLWDLVNQYLHIILKILNKDENKISSLNILNDLKLLKMKNYGWFDEISWESQPGRAKLAKDKVCAFEKAVQNVCFLCPLITWRDKPTCARFLWNIKIFENPNSMNQKIFLYQRYLLKIEKKPFPILYERLVFLAWREIISPFFFRRMSETSWIAIALIDKNVKVS